MKVLYNTCFADPWVKVAKVLRDKYNMVPSHWIGNQFDDSDKIVPTELPNCRYYPRLDLWRGVFPAEVEKNLNRIPLDIDFLKEISLYELQGLKMMDRMDNDQHSFSFMERQRLFRNNLKKWAVFLDIHKPDIVISAIVPHRAYDYPLYLLCKHLNIPFLFFKNSSFRGRIVHAEGINTISQKLRNDYLDYQVNVSEKSTDYESLESDIFNEFSKVLSDYSVAVPGYMKRHVKRDKQESNFIGLAYRLFNLIKNNREKYLGKEAYIIKGIPSYYKEKNKSIEKSRMSLFSHISRKRKGVSIKKSLKKHYESLTIQPDFNQKFVFLPLHYQPEMTSSPSGDLFVDQTLCVDVLAANLPPDYYIYVKEHPSQFYAHTEGHTSRIKEFYDDILKYKNVRLIPLDSNPFHLIKKSRAIATITGTAGWEAMVLRKPVIIFGLSWYEYYDGVLKITDNLSARKIASFIENFSFDQTKLYCYLKAFQDNSAVAYYDLGLKSLMDLPEDVCVDNLVNLINNCVWHK